MQCWAMHSKRACDELPEERLDHGRQSTRDVWSDGCVESTIHGENACAALQSATLLRCALSQRSPIAAMLSLRNSSRSSQYIACEDCVDGSQEVSDEPELSTSLHAPLSCSPQPRSRCRSQENPRPAAREVLLSQERAANTSASTHLPNFALALPAHKQREEQRNAARVQNAHEHAGCSRANTLNTAELCEWSEHAPDA